MRFCTWVVGREVKLPLRSGAFINGSDILFNGSGILFDGSGILFNGSRILFDGIGVVFNCWGRRRRQGFRGAWVVQVRCGSLMLHRR